MATRIRLVLLVFILAFIALLARLFYWQILKGKVLSIQAREQYKEDFTLKAPRGDVLASDESWFVAGTEAWLLYATLPNLEEKPEKIAEKLAPLFVDEGEEPRDEKILEETFRLTQLLSKEGLIWVPLRHKLDSETKKKIEELEIKGLGFEVQETRTYPEASSAAHLLGFVGKDENGADKGYFGLEGYYDLVLTGKPGFLSREEDASGVPIFFGNSQEILPVRGVNLLTHIDKSIQLTLEKKLKDGIDAYGANAGTAIVMNPRDGAILAMASYPSYDPVTYYNFGDEFFTNAAISSAFEPGSVFKVLIMASALDAGAVKPDTVCSICSGPYKVDKYYIETWNQQYRPNSTMTEVIMNSDNVGMVYVANSLGIEKLHDYLWRFGIGQLTGIDLQGEVTPKLREKGEWSIVDLATASFGQGVAVTPIQLTRAVGAIANGGVLVKPQVVDKIVSKNWEEDIKPEEGTKAISEKAAKEITAMMVEAAKSGESKWTHVRGFKVAGKTGTAQIPIAGHYDEDKTIASFIGFAPYDNPKFVMLVTLQEPKSSPWASETAAPLWYSIARDLFIHLGIQPEQ